MPKEQKTTQLPQAAKDHMSNTAKENLAEHAPHVVTSNGPEPIYHHNTAFNDVFTGTDGVVDYFLFDMTVFSGVDFIYNYDAEDHIVFYNTQGTQTYVTDPLYGNDDPEWGVAGEDYSLLWYDPDRTVTHHLVGVEDPSVVPTITTYAGDLIA
jgi:hypothetical protein